MSAQMAGGSGKGGAVRGMAEGWADAPDVVFRAEGLTKRYFKNYVVRDVSMMLRRGEVYGLVGRNGAGKSTFMKMACGFVLPTRGGVEVLGRAMKPGEGHPRVGALIEQPGLYPGLSAHDNVMCRALALGLVDPKAEVAKVLGLVGLDDTSRERASSFSLGMKQRLGMALALVGTPDLLFLDEPFNGIDVAGTRALRKVLVDLAEERGVTIMVSSHVIDQLVRFVTRYGVMVEGRLMCEKTVEEVERACADCLCVRSPIPERALAVLAEAFPQASLSLLADGEIRLDAGVGPSDAARTLVASGVEVTQLNMQSGDMEAYFARLMAGGESHA